jgi:hypothetical protein
MSTSTDILGYLSTIRSQMLLIEEQVPFENLDRKYLFEHPDDHVVYGAIQAIYAALESIRKVEHQAAVGAMQIVPGVGSADYELLQRLRDAGSRLFGLWCATQPIDLFDLFENVDLEGGAQSGAASTHAPIKTAIWRAMQEFPEIADGDDWDAIDALDWAWEVIGAPYFQPDNWWNNNRDIRPALASGMPRISPQLKRRVEEIYVSYLFGNFLAAIVMARAVLEYLLKDRAGSLQLDGIRRRDEGEIEYLIRSVSMKLALDRQPLDFVRQLGNQVAHPPLSGDREEISEYPIQRESAFKCIEIIRNLVEKVYRDR